MGRTLRASPRRHAAPKGRNGGQRLFGAAPVVLAVLVISGAMWQGAHALPGLPRLLGETLLFGVAASLLAWPIASFPPFARVTEIWCAVPTVSVGVVAGLGARQLPQSVLVAWLVGVAVTAIAIAPRLGVELSEGAASTRKEVVDAALALGASTRQARRLASDSDGTVLRTLGTALALGLTDGIAALAAFRAAGLVHPQPASVALLASHSGGAVLVVVLATSLSALRGGWSRDARKSAPRPLTLTEAMR